MTKTGIISISSISDKKGHPAVLSASLTTLFSELYRLEFRKTATAIRILIDRYHDPYRFSAAISGLIKRHLISRSMADEYLERYRQETNTEVSIEDNRYPQKTA